VPYFVRILLLSFVFCSTTLLFLPTKVLASSSSSFSSKIRVKIGQNLKDVTVGGTDIKRYLYGTKDLRQYPGRNSIKFHCNDGKDGSNGKARRLAQIYSPTGVLSWEGKRYRGELLLISNASSGCDLINIVPLESYISTLLSTEMNGTWPIEALKAQAIAARSYAIYKIQNDSTSKEKGSESYYDIESSEKHQVSGSFFDATPFTDEAAKKTKGMVLLTKEGSELVPIFYHAKCGGRTIAPDQVWSNSVTGYQSVACPHCNSSGQKQWTKTISISQFKNFVNWLARSGHISKSVDVSKIKEGGLYLPADDLMKSKVGIYQADNLLVINKSLFRRYFSKTFFPSNRWKLTITEKELSFIGEGLGHGVGMCQIGALDMAKSGKNVTEILNFYFPGHKIARVY